MIGALRAEILDREIRRYCTQRQGIKASRDYVTVVRTRPTEATADNSWKAGAMVGEGSITALVSFAPV
jgi:hypothetical protein